MKNILVHIILTLCWGSVAVNVVFCVNIRCKCIYDFSISIKHHFQFELMSMKINWPPVYSTWYHQSYSNKNWAFHGNINIAKIENLHINGCCTLRCFHIGTGDTGTCVQLCTTLYSNARLKLDTSNLHQNDFHLFWILIAFSQN